MKDFLNVLQSLFVIVYCFLGSAAFVKYLLGEERGSSRNRQAKHKRTRKPAVTLELPEDSAQSPRTPEAPAEPGIPVPRQQEPQPESERALVPEPIQYPQNLPPGAPELSYEVANPGYKLTEGYSLQLQPSAYGVLRACRIGDAICVYVQTGLEDASADIKRLGLLQLYDMYDQYGNQYRVLPMGCLRIRNHQPALCMECGSNLTLLSKGRLLVIPVDGTA